MIFLLAAYRRLAGLSAQKVADNMGVPRSTVTLLETGNRNATNDIIEKYSRCISKYFDYDSSAFLNALNSYAQTMVLSDNEIRNNINFINCVKNVSISMLKQQFI